jgi:hypothetical protein
MLCKKNLHWFPRRCVSEACCLGLIMRSVFSYNNNNAMLLYNTVRVVQYKFTETGNVLVYTALQLPNLSDFKGI